MATHLFPHYALSRYSLILVSLLTLIGILGGCGSSSAVSSLHPTGSTSTPTRTQELKGTISEIMLPAHVAAGDITTGPDGNLWFTAGDTIGRITPIGVIRVFSIPATANSSVGGIADGPDGNLWFTEDTDNQSQNGKIGRITLTGSISEFPLPTPRGGPGAITGGPDGKICLANVIATRSGISSEAGNQVLHAHVYD